MLALKSVTVHHILLLTLYLKRAGDYVLDWGEELETQHRLLAHGKPATSTLVKRPAASRKAEGSERATKKVKTENTGDGEVKNYYEKGSLNEV